MAHLVPEGTPRGAELQTLLKIHGADGWDVAWKAAFTPWEQVAGHQAAFKDLLEAKGLPFQWPQRGKALVPGCGRGYDAILLGETLELEVLGVDISQGAIDAARQHLQSTGSIAKVSYEAGDFFARHGPAEQFTLAYDVTFFVAIPPALRPEWGRQMNMQIAPGGLLIALVWPIHPTRNTGPPYGVDPELTAYTIVLGECWQKVYECDATEKMATGFVEGSTAKIVVWQKLLGQE